MCLQTTHFQRKHALQFAPNPRTNTNKDELTSQSRSPSSGPHALGLHDFGEVLTWFHRRLGMSERVAAEWSSRAATGSPPSGRQALVFYDFGEGNFGDAIWRVGSDAVFK